MQILCLTLDDKRFAIGSENKLYLNWIEDVWISKIRNLTSSGWIGRTLLAPIVHKPLYGILLFHFISGDEDLKSQHDKCSPAL